MRDPWLLVALLLAVAGCGTGTDGRPVAPPTTSTPPPAPPPGQPTGVRVVERGQDFLVWAWEPVRGATGYEGHAFRHGIPASERPPHQVTVEPTFRAEGLEAGVRIGFFVRAIRETAGGRAVGPWSDYAQTYTLAPDRPVAACSNERQLALDYEIRARLVHEWNPERPFRVWVDEEAIRSGGTQLGNPNFLKEQVLEPLRVVADRIEERLGYPIFDPDDLLPSQSSRDIAVRRVDNLGRRDTPWDSRCAPATHAPMSAVAALATVQYNDYFFDPAVACSGFDTNRRGKTIVHELAHLFAMKHAASTGDASSRRRNGVHMSEPLTGSFFFDRANILPTDIDAIGCVFPHPDYPR